MSHVADACLEYSHFLLTPLLALDDLHKSFGAGERSFMLTKLLVGDAIDMKSDSKLLYPPANPATDRRYDTITGVTQGSKVYMVYENGEYKRRAKSIPA